MSDNKTSQIKSGESISDFKSKWGSPTQHQVKEERKTKFKNVIEIFQGIGWLPTFKSSKSKGHRGHGGGHAHSHAGSDFRASQRVNVPSKPSHEDMVVAHMAHDAYMDLVDGKGDDER